MRRGWWREVSGFLLTVLFYGMWAPPGLFFTVFVFPPMLLLGRRFPGMVTGFRHWVRGFYAAILRGMDLAGALRVAEVQGIERLRRGGACVVVANHRTLLDVLVLLSLIPDASCLLKPMKKASTQGGRNSLPAFWRPFITAPFSLLGYVPMPSTWDDREGLRRTIDLCRVRLSEGRPLIIFPEGTRSPDGHLLQFRDLAFRLATEAGVPVVPVVLHSDTRFMPHGSIAMRSARRCTYRLRVLPDIVPGARSRSSDLLVEARHRLQKALAEHDEKHGFLFE